MRERVALVVEDDNEWREIFSECLEALGFRVDKAPRLALALKLLRSPDTRYSIVVIDASLDQVADSLAEAEILLDELGQHISIPRVIVVSGYWQRHELRAHLAHYGSLISEVGDKTMLGSKAMIADLLQGGSNATRPPAWIDLERDYLTYAESSRDRSGRTFQDLVERWLNLVSPYEVVDRNRLTTTGELDLIARCEPGSFPLAGRYGEYLLVECKDRADVIGVSPVDHLAGLMQRTDVHVGALVSLRGSSGRNAGRDARGAREFLFPKGFLILDIQDSDLRNVLSGGETFRELVLRQLHALHFA